LRAFVLHAVPQETLHPKAQRRRKYRECGDGNLSGSLTPAKGARPGKERHDASRIPDVVAEVEVVRVRVVEVHSSFDEPQAEDADVEVEITLRVARDRRDVMDAVNGRHAHVPGLQL